MPDLIRHSEQHGTENAAAALLDPGSKAGVTVECAVRFLVSFTLDETWLYYLRHLAQPSDVMPNLIRHPEQHGTEDAAAALLDPGSEAGMTGECVVRALRPHH
ncbi:hypothetical protein A3843_02040 [Pseudovibrio exalbescens]|uniref:Uncharacterized protein n=2 Tax=Pseudovibrio exalbescens TaxID=197461 RepID=A0A1U7JLZ0_9HYPH|nr:hypothetical protein A3843_02040 [Pseudovibrio exalbescens]